MGRKVTRRTPKVTSSVEAAPPAKVVVTLDLWRVLLGVHIGVALLRALDTVTMTDIVEELDEEGALSDLTQEQRRWVCARVWMLGPFEHAHEAGQTEAPRALALSKRAEGRAYPHPGPPPLQ